MNDDDRPVPITRGEWLLLAAIVIIFILLRVPLWREPALRLGWNSDAAIFGLMAKSIYGGTQFPIFFWGQSYMGPLTSFLTAAAGLLTGAAGVHPAVGPLALRLAVAAEVLAAIALYWITLRRVFGAATSALVVLWLAIGPSWLLFFTIAPIGGEQMLLLSAVIFWFSIRTMLLRPRDWFVFGLISGLGWWIHQGIVFATGAALAIVFLRSDVWATAWPAPQLLDRLLLRTDRLRWREDDRFLILLLRWTNVLLLLWIVDGALFSLRLPVPGLFLFSPLLEPLVGFCIYRLLLALTFGADLRDALALLVRRRRDWLLPSLLFVSGAVLGYLPVIAGGLLGLYPRTYGLSVPPLPIAGIAGHVLYAIRRDFWLFIGASDSPFAMMVGVCVVALLVLAVIRHRARLVALITLTPADYGRRGIAAATMILCALFYLTSRRATEGSVRYIVSALPMLYAFAAEELWRLRPRVIAIAGMLAITLGLAVPRIGQVRDVVAGRGEQYANLGGNFDPRPTLKTIEAANYQVCYAEYWIAYKLQWVSDERVRFIPFHSLDRTPAASHALEIAPGRKCYVDAAGGVREFRRQDFDESVMEAARERLLRMEKSK